MKITTYTTRHAKRMDDRSTHRPRASSQPRGEIICDLIRLLVTVKSDLVSTATRVCCDNNTLQHCRQLFVFLSPELLDVNPVGMSRGEVMFIFGLANDIMFGKRFITFGTSFYPLIKFTITFKATFLLYRNPSLTTLYWT